MIPLAEYRPRRRRPIAHPRIAHPPPPPMRDGPRRDRDRDEVIRRQEQRLRFVERELLRITRRLEEVLARVRGDEIAPFRPWDGDGQEAAGS